MCELVGEQAICAQDLGGRARYGFVGIVAGAVAGPDDKVYVVGDVGRDPVEGSIDEGHGRVAVGSLGAVESRGTCTAVTGMVFGGGAVDFVEVVGVEVGDMQEPAVQFGAWGVCGGYYWRRRWWWCTGSGSSDDMAQQACCEQHGTAYYSRHVQGCSRVMCVV